MKPPGPVSVGVPQTWATPAQEHHEHLTHVRGDVCSDQGVVPAVGTCQGLN